MFFPGLQEPSFKQLTVSDSKLPDLSKLVWMQVLLPACSASGVHGRGQLVVSFPLNFDVQISALASLGSEQLREFLPQGQGLPGATQAVENPVTWPVVE